MRRGRGGHGAGMHHSFHGSGGEISPVSLSDLAQGEEATVIGIAGGHGMRHRLHDLGVVEGRRMKKLSALAWGGPVIIRLDRAQVAIGRGMASHIMVDRTDG